VPNEDTRNFHQEESTRKFNRKIRKNHFTTNEKKSNRFMNLLPEKASKVPAKKNHQEKLKGRFTKCHFWKADF